MDYLKGVSESGIFVVFVEYGSHTSKHLQEEGLPVEDVELFADVLDGGGDQVVGLVVGVDPQQVRHDEEVSVGRENGLELVGGVDDCRHAIPANV